MSGLGTYANVKARASLYDKSFDVTSGHNVASRKILVIMVLEEHSLATVLKKSAKFSWLY
jgi:hypothetical protein